MWLLNHIFFNAFVWIAVSVKESGGKPQDQSSNQESKSCNNWPPLTDVRVMTKHGTYIGKQSTFEGNGLMSLCPVAQFLGIAYAQPPTSERRWKKPLPLNIDGNTKSKNDTGISHTYKKRLPVMVYFHGHTFMDGSGNFYDGSVLASFGKVVVVTLNYRIGVLGFLSFLSGDNLGNYGLWDQLEALKWIKKNIANFGGDPHRLTAFGSGSGAISIHLLMMTHHADNTFNRAILQSGTALSPMALVKLPTSQAELIAQRLNCSRIQTNDIMQCLGYIHWRDLVKASGKQEKYKVNFGPVIDRQFVQGPPRETMKNRDYMSYQIIVGLSQNDGYGYFKQSDGDVFTSSLDDASSIGTEKSFLIAVDRFVDAFYNRTKSRDGVDITDVLRTMIDYVYRDPRAKLTPQRAMTALLNMYTDSQWLTPTVQTAQVNSKLDQPTYFYTFGYKPDEKRKKSFWITAAHGDELPFVFGYPFMGTKDGIFPYAFTDRDGEVSIKVMEYWTNFAKTGDPMGQSGSASRVRLSNWPRYDENKRIGLHISSRLNNVSQYRHKQYQFWNNLVPRLQDLFRLKRKATYYGHPSVRSVRLTINNNRVTNIPWWPPSDGTMAVNPQSETGGGSRKSESGMSLQLTITLAIGFVLIFVNIIAFSIVSYHKRIDKYKIKKLRSELEERKRLLESELRSCGVTNPCSSSPDEMILDGSRDCKIIAKPLDGATTSSSVSRVAADSIYPPHCSSNATFPLLKQCTLRDDTPSTSGSQQMQTRLSCIDDMQADVNPSSDESPLNVMTSHRKIDSGHPNVIIRRPQPCGVKREVASLDGNYEYHVPDLKFKTYSVRASYAGQLTFPEASGLPAAVKKQTSLWSLTSTAGSLNPTYRNHCRADYSRGHIQSKDSLVTSLVNGGPIEPSKALVHRGDVSLHNERAPSVIGDFTKLSQSHPAPTLSGKSRVSSEISESETDATMSSPASDRVGSYCVMNNKLNVVTKL